MDTITILDELLNLCVRINQGLKPLDENASNTIAKNLNEIKAQSHVLRMNTYKDVTQQNTSERENEIIAMIKGK